MALINAILKIITERQCVSTTADLVFLQKYEIYSLLPINKSVGLSEQVDNSGEKEYFSSFCSEEWIEGHLRLTKLVSLDNFLMHQHHLSTHC